MPCLQKNIYIYILIYFFKRALVYPKPGSPTVVDKAVVPGPIGGVCGGSGGRAAVGSERAGSWTCALIRCTADGVRVKRNPG